MGGGLSSYSSPLGVIFELERQLLEGLAKAGLEAKLVIANRSAET